MWTTATRLPGSRRFHPRSGDGATTRAQARWIAEVASLHAEIDTLKHEQRIQLERIAQMQAQLDQVTKLLETLASAPKPRRPRAR